MHIHAALPVLLTLLSLAAPSDWTAQSSSGAKPAPANGLKDATGLLGEVRQALGGAARIAGVGRLMFSGESRLFSGDGRLMSTNTLEVELGPPTRFLRAVERSFPPSVQRDGMDGEKLIQENQSRDPGMVAGVKPPTEAEKLIRLRRVREEATVLLLACLVTDRTPIPVRFMAGGRATSPDGDADMLVVTNPEGFQATVFVDVETHRPLMIEYNEARAVRNAPGDTVSRGMGRVPSEPVQRRLYLGDHRRVDGIWFPYEWRFARGGGFNETWQIKSVRLRPQ